MKLDCDPSALGVATLNCLPNLFSNVLNALLAFSGVAALFFIILSGIKLTTSGGDPKQIEGARQTLTYAIIGLLVILLSFFIINLISTVTNVGCIKQFGFTNCEQSSSPTNSTPRPISPQNRELNPH